MQGVDMSGIDSSASLNSGSARVARRIAAATVALLTCGYFGWQSLASQSPAAVAVAQPPAVPVQATVATRRDVPLYLTGLGTVQAFNTVTVKTRVDGELQKVAFTEGQDAKAGDLLAQIDPRPFQAPLAQATAET